MSVDAKNTDTLSDDIDLLLLLERAILFLRKFKWVFIVAAFLGISAGIYMYRILPNIYTSRMIVHSFLLTNEEEIGMVDNWNQLLKKKEYTALASIFNCSENTLSKLKQLKAEEIQKVFTPTNPNGFFIEVNVTDNTILDELQKGIVYGFENGPYIKERLTVRRANLTELIAKTAIEVQRLDSTKKLVENIIGGNGKSSSSLIIDGSALNRQLIDMNEKLLDFRQELEFANAVQVLQGFSQFPKPVGPKLFVWLILGLVVFLALAYIYAIFSSVNEKLRARSRLQNTR